MRMKGLSLETIPSIHVPFRFFNTAPWMGVLAALVLLLEADSVFSSSWNPGLLAMTHLLTLGFISMVMLGAMFQIVPVLSGEMIPGGVLVATSVHILLCAGILSLVVGFYWQAYWLFSWAIPLLLSAFVVFLLPLASLLRRRIGGGDSIYSIRFAVLALLISIGLGLVRAANYAGLLQWAGLPNTISLHLGWGLGGWVLLLVMGVSYQVIPMFHVTPNYSTHMAKVLPTAVFSSMLLLTFVANPVIKGVAVLVLCLAATTYGIISIRLLRRRKRKVPDITARFWHMGLLSLIVAASLVMIIYFSDHLFPSIRWREKFYIGTGIILIFGFAVSVIMGMLQKIVPFLSYLHLQRSCMNNFDLLKTLPHMGEFVPPGFPRWQFRLHLAALLLLLVATVTGQLVELCGLLLIVDFSWLGLTLARASRLYLSTAKRVALHNQS
ncbi:MAG: hypothetical protein IMF06_07305 [Proteobacteria bacterium]|nr:hypothetical protein [Pseudomonadota bacterium]